MKHINYLLFGLLFLFGFAGCEKKDIGALHEVHWDRDMCVRCKTAKWLSVSGIMAFR